MVQKLVKNAVIYTPVDPGTPLGGDQQGELNRYSNGCLLIEEGRIKAIGSISEIEREGYLQESYEEIDAGGRCVIPGFVDPHTHMCFASRRESEFELRIGGTPYLEILKKGGGILSSVEKVAQASEDELYEVTASHVNSALEFGTTTLEIKSGYGLDLENELKMLRVIGRVADNSVQDIVATFLGAHAIPAAYKGNGDGFIQHAIEDMLPAVREQGIASQCDIFCEEGVFTIEQSRKLLTAAKRLGMDVKLI